MDVTRDTADDWAAAADRRLKRAHVRLSAAVSGADRKDHSSEKPHEPRPV